MGVEEKGRGEAVEEVVQVKAGEGEGGMAGEVKAKVAPCVHVNINTLSLEMDITASGETVRATSADVGCMSAHADSHM
jgi:hypothetical protein